MLEKYPFRGTGRTKGSVAGERVDVVDVVNGEAASLPPTLSWWACVVVGFLGVGLVSSVIVFSGPFPFLIGVIGLILWRRDLRGHTGLLAIVIAVAANAFNVGASLWFLTLPADISIRPMVWNAQVLLVGAVTIPAVGLLALHSFWRQRQKPLLPVVAFAVAIESLFIGSQVLTVAAMIRGFTLSAN